MSELSGESLIPGEVPAISETKQERAIRIRQLVRAAGCEAATVLPDRIHALRTELAPSLAKMREQDPNAKDTLHQAMNILDHILQEAGEWAVRAAEICGPPQDAAPQPEQPTSQSTERPQLRAVPPFVRVTPTSSAN